MWIPEPIRSWIVRLVADHYLGERRRRQEVASALDRVSVFGLGRELVAQMHLRLGSERVWVTPRAVRVELTNRCNLKCVMCPQPETMRRPKKHLDIELYRRFLEANPRIQEIHLFNWGEPLLHPEVGEFVAEAARRGIYSSLVTNAVLLDARRARALIEAGLSAIHFSLDGTAEDFQRIRGIPIERPMANIRGFLAINQESGARVFTGIAITQSSWNRERAHEIADELTAIGADIVQIHPSEEYSPEYRRRIPCVEPYRYAVVLSDTRVVPCCVDFDGELSFGSVADEIRLDRLYNGPDIRRLRRDLRHADTMPKLCSRCTFKIPLSERPSWQR